MFLACNRSYARSGSVQSDRLVQNDRGLEECLQPHLVEGLGLTLGLALGLGRVMVSSHLVQGFGPGPDIRVSVRVR